MGMEDDFLQNDVDDEKTIEYIKNYLPQELKEKFSDDEFYYFLDLIDEYYSESGILDAQQGAQVVLQLQQHHFRRHQQNIILALKIVMQHSGGHTRLLRNILHRGHLIRSVADDTALQRPAYFHTALLRQ